MLHSVLSRFSLGGSPTSPQQHSPSNHNDTRTTMDVGGVEFVPSENNNRNVGHRRSTSSSIQSSKRSSLKHNTLSTGNLMSNPSSSCISSSTTHVADMTRRVARFIMTINVRTYQELTSWMAVNKDIISEALIYAEGLRYENFHEADPGSGSSTSTSDEEDEDTRNPHAHSRGHDSNKSKDVHESSSGLESHSNGLFLPAEMSALREYDDMSSGEVRKLGGGGTEQQQPPMHLSAWQDNDSLDLRLVMSRRYVGNNWRRSISDDKTHLLGHNMGSNSPGNVGAEDDEEEEDSDEENNKHHVVEIKPDLGVVVPSPVGSPRLRRHVAHIHDDDDGGERRMQRWVTRHNLTKKKSFSETEAIKLMTPEQKEIDTWMKRRERIVPVWEAVFFMVVLYNYLVIPARVGFEEPATVGLIAFDLLLDIILMFSVAIRFYIPECTDDDLKDTRITKAETRREYLLSYGIWLDVLGAIPFDLIGIGLYAHGVPQVTMFKSIPCILLPYYRLPKLLIVHRLGRVSMRTLSRFISSVLDFSPVVWRIAHSFLVFLFAVHLASCSWFWILLYLGKKDGFSSWANDDTLYNATFTMQYTTAVDFTTKNMVGMSRGSGFPSSDIGICFMVCLSILGVGLYSTLIATIGNLISNQETGSAKFAAKMDEVIDFLKYKKLPERFSKQVLTYYHHIYDTSSTLVTLQSEFLADLPRSLRRKMALQVGTSILQRVPIFQLTLLNHEFVIQIASKLRALVFPPLTSVVTVGDIGEAMYFVLCGTLKVMTGDGAFIASLRRGDFFGEIAILVGCPRTATVLTVTYTNLMELRRDDFSAVTLKNPQCLESVRDRAKERLAVIYAEIEKKRMYYGTFMVGSYFETVYRYFGRWKSKVSKDEDTSSRYDLSRIVFAKKGKFNPKKFFGMNSKNDGYALSPLVQSPSPKNTPPTSGIEQKGKKIVSPPHLALSAKAQIPVINFFPPEESPLLDNTTVSYVQNFGSPTVTEMDEKESSDTSSAQPLNARRFPRVTSSCDNHSELDSESDVDILNSFRRPLGFLSHPHGQRGGGGGGGTSRPGGRNSTQSDEITPNSPLTQALQEEDHDYYI